MTTIRSPFGRRARRVALVAGAATVALAFSACAGGSADAGGEDGDFTGQELSVLMISSHEGAAEWLTTEFEKETGAIIKPVIVPYDEIGSKLALDQQSGANTIDVAAPWYTSLGDLAADGAIQDLTEWVDGNDAIDVDDFIPSIWEPYSQVDGKTYGLPFDGDTHVLFYNKEILARNGFDTPPKTWDEYLEQTKTITENEGADGVYGAAVFGQKSPLILGASFANRLAGFGGEFVDEDGKPTINSPEAVAAAQALVDVNDYALPTPAETDFGAGNSAWFAGKVGFIENWTDLGVRSQDPESGSEVVDKWGVTLLPTGGDNTQSRASLVAGFSWVISANTQKTALAQKFIEFASSSEVNAKLLTALPPTGIDPNRVSSLEDPTYGEEYPEIQEANRATLDGALAWPTGENATEAAQVLTDELAKLLAGEGGSAQDTLDRVQAEWEDLLG
ncbi:carbohydrate ABC transporter substrate-binding protein (CUT1 family) [Labedella gwakjiensis]|uniref:Carbohydrate ABC transporter substrate-binding protein (CUT1 family) n=1 Tax=Labedella gwakjiensis TaxID=390269 RepID=A0A2P8GWJ0_9MICO|nr:sugar ABC transporter substrate-binding protein [Labedella gwakjiensis]PSL38328.1 carbohydrate ABC transporter substrate-binding protein (CUT1 family) [Labedella gwakjiensis]RUQ87138.1 sugar ABC transporter substrate-binding protein [Labedella gwakjiensis]